MDYTDEDVPLIKQWQAHRDAINHIQWVSELGIIASCSFDKNVFMWNNQGIKMGSLVLGNRAEDMGKIKKGVTPWQIKIDKVSRFKEEMREAEVLFDKSEQIDYAEMRE